MRRIVTDLVIAAGLYWLTCSQFRQATGVIQHCDSGYSLAVSERLLVAGSVDLEATLPVDRAALPWYSPDTGLPYQLVRVGSAVYYGYPLGSSILSIPFVQRYASKGVSVFRPDGVLDPGSEAAVQQKIASKVSAFTVVMFYVTARFFCPPIFAVFVALGFAFGSPVSSTLSRALWSHTWQVALLAAAVNVLVASRTYRDRVSWPLHWLLGSILGTLLFWAIVVRPHSVISAIAVGVYLLIWHRQLIPGTLLSGIGWVAGYIAVCLHAFGSPTSPSVYAAGAIDGHDVFNRFAWLMLSPSRGLLVYCPYLAVVAWGLVVYRREMVHRSLLVPSGLAVAGYVVVFSSYDGWHAGSSYGPRYFSDVTPWFVLATAMAAGAMARSTSSGFRWRAVPGWALLVSTFVWAVFVHHRGANAVAAWEWNYLSNRLGQESAVKDWSHPQFLAGLTYRVLPDGSVVEP